METDWSPLHSLANASELAREGLVSLSPAAQTRPSGLPKIFWDKILEMHGQDVKLVLEKRLCATDMKRWKGRLSMPKKQIQGNFLSSGEEQALNDKEAITVSLIEPCLQVRRGLLLQKWNRRNHFSYLLTKNWTAVTHPISRNRLRRGRLVQLWSFRAKVDLCFCLVNVSAPPVAAENMANQE